MVYELYLFITIRYLYCCGFIIDKYDCLKPTQANACSSYCQQRFQVLPTQTQVVADTGCSNNCQRTLNIMRNIFIDRNYNYGIWYFRIYFEPALVIVSAVYGVKGRYLSVVNDLKWLWIRWTQNIYDLAKDEDLQHPVQEHMLRRIELRLLLWLTTEKGKSKWNVKIRERNKINLKRMNKRKRNAIYGYIWATIRLRMIFKVNDIQWIHCHHQQNNKG